MLQNFNYSQLELTGSSLIVNYGVQILDAFAWLLINKMSRNAFTFQNNSCVAIADLVHL